MDTHTHTHTHTWSDYYNYLSCTCAPSVNKYRLHNEVKVSMQFTPPSAAGSEEVFTRIHYVYVVFIQSAVQCSVIIQVYGVSIFPLPTTTQRIYVFNSIRFSIIAIEEDGATKLHRSTTSADVFCEHTCSTRSKLLSITENLVILPLTKIGEI